MNEFYLHINEEAEYKRCGFSILELDDLISLKEYESELDKLTDLFLIEHNALINDSIETTIDNNNLDYEEDEDDENEVKELDFTKDSFKRYTQDYINNLDYEDNFFRLSDEI